MFPYIYNIVLASLAAYICACVVGASSLFEPLRIKIKQKLPKLQIGNHKHFIECRLCLSFWTSLISVILFGLSIELILPVYGMSYFLATQER